ncbi:MAG: DUF192 domain-containing protein, partial [Acidimicrobiia bacterium]|nr:DUF192 domain-containing protein [Acidimicrobiia bacterium]
MSDPLRTVAALALALIMAVTACSDTTVESTTTTPSSTTPSSTAPTPTTPSSTGPTSTGPTSTGPTATSALPTVPDGLAVPSLISALPLAVIAVDDEPLIVAIADSSATRRQGLMVVDDLLDLDGMLFVWETDSG